MNDTFSEKAKMWDSNPQIIAMTDLFVAELDKIIPDPSRLRILEFGCGTGLVGLQFVEKASFLDMIDTSPSMLEVLRAKDEVKASHVTIHEGTISTLVKQATMLASVDWVISNMTLHHVENIPALIRDLYLLIKPGGRLTIGELVTEPGTFHAPDIVPHNGFDPQELSQIFKKEGFIPSKPRTYLNMPKEGSDGVTRNYSAFILDTSRHPTK